MNTALSVGAVIAAHTPAEWVCDLLSTLELHPSIALQAVVVNPQTVEQTTQANSGVLSSIGRWLLLNKIDKQRFSQNPWQPTALPENIKLIDNTEMANALSRCSVVLNLCHADLPSTLVETLETTVWHAHLESLDARIEHALLEQEPLTWVHLWSCKINQTDKSRLTKLVASHALPRQTYSLTDLRRAAYCSLPSIITSRLNWKANNSNVLETELENPAISCAAISQERTHCNQRADNLANNHFVLPAYSDAGYLLHVVSLWFRQTQQRLSDRIWIEQWQLSVCNHGQDSSNLISNIAATRLEDYQAISSPSDLLRADPHACEHAGQMHIFYEEMPTNGSKAHIACAKIDASGNASDFKVVLEEKQHLSYPFVFSHNGIIHMIPETASRKTVTLYKARNFPEQWDRVGDLLTDINAADSTVVYHENRWWMFTNSQTHRVVDERDELRLYFADDITGPWQAHPLNPILTGVDRARMAGPIIVENGILHRASQYGAVRYGYGVNLNRIDRLDATHYQETPVARIVPEHGSAWKGCHSITRIQGLTILDRVCRQRR